MYMEYENINISDNKELQEQAERKVNAFLSSCDFVRTFPLNLIDLAEKMGAFKIYYMSAKNEFYNRSVGAIAPLHKQIVIHTRFKDDLWNFLMGRYVICKLVARYALGYVKNGGIWIEETSALRNEEDKKTNEETANFAFELLMPSVEFKRQWALLGRDVKKLSNYFGAPEFKVTERAMFLGLYYGEKHNQ